MIKAVIFDLDDTLVETRPTIWEHHKTVAKKFYNIDLDEETLLKHWGKPFNILIQELYQNSDTPENMLKANISMRHDFHKKVYKESVSVVTKIIASGIKVGILSAANKDLIIEDMMRLRFPVGRLAAIQGHEDTSVHKPDPDVFLPIFEKLEKEGIKKEEMVYVGDSLDDLRAATAAGIDFIAVTTGLYSEEDFKKNGAEIIAKDINEVGKILAK